MLLVQKYYARRVYLCSTNFIGACCIAAVYVDSANVIYNFNVSMRIFKSGKNQHCPRMPMSLTKITSTSEI